MSGDRQTSDRQTSDSATSPLIETAQAGLILRDGIIFAVVLAVLVFVVGNLVHTARYAAEAGDAKSRITAANHAVLDEIREAMTGAVTVFKQERSAAAVGHATWIDLLDLPEDAAPIPFTCLPRLTTTGALGPELVPGGRTGNAVLFATPLSETEIRTGSTHSYRIQTYEFVFYYLTAVGAGPRSGSRDGLNLCRYVSVPMADAAQLEDISDDSERAEVLRRLVDGRVGPVVAWAWRRHATPERALLRIDSATSSLQGGRGAHGEHKLPPDRPRSRWQMLPLESYSVASVWAEAGVGVASFGKRTEERGGFPHGFEVQLAGSAATRQVALHLTLVTVEGDGPRASADQRTLALVRDS